MAEKEARVQSRAANDPSVLKISEKVPIRTFSCLSAFTMKGLPLKETTSAFTFKRRISVIV